MARTAGSSGAKTLKAIRKVAIRQIHERGYEAMNLRQLAADVGIQAGSLYNHIRNKQDLLYEIMRTVMTDLHGGLDTAMTGISTPPEQMHAFIDYHIRFNAKRRKEVFISTMELRSLSRENYKSIVASRTDYEDRLRKILSDGKDQGYWTYDDLDVSAYALLAMLSGIVTWYRASGRLTIEELIEAYNDIALKSLNARKDQI
jgi:AcrR family transcriptional regulator